MTVTRAAYVTRVTAAPVPREQPIPVLSRTSMSSDYWSEDDAEFIALLNTIEIPGEEPPKVNDGNGPQTTVVQHDVEQPNLKRPRSPSSEDGQRDSGRRAALALVDENNEASGYLQYETYGASSFGGFGDYMRRKRAKLQIQNAEIDGDGGASSLKSRIFNGLQIYVRMHASARARWG